jgi:antitoxin component YwqK of YwqJK toxin-antitoxin module
MIGYKIGQIKVDSKQIRVLITLDIDINNCKTNLNRKDIKDKEYAKYRCDKAKVISIEDNEGNKYSNAFSPFYDKIIEYKVGEKVEEPVYNKDIDVVCGEGIHFFINKEIALLYGLDRVENGEYKKWYDNGQLFVQKQYVEGKEQGEYKRWNDDGQLIVLSHYVDGKYHGEYKQWYENGQLEIQTQYIEGKYHGEYKSWHRGANNSVEDRGQLHIQTHYIEGKENGEYKQWWSNGQIRVQIHYVDDKRQGEYKRWFWNGQIEVHSHYNIEGEYHGEYKQWDIEGQLESQFHYINNKIHSKYKEFDIEAV